MRILPRTSIWRVLTLLVLVICSCFLLSEAFARGARTKVSSKSSRTLISPSTPTAATRSVTTKQQTTANLQAISGDKSPPSPNAPTPDSGTLSPGNPEINYNDTLVTNTTGSLLGEPVCIVPATCSDFTLTVNAQSVAATKQILIEGQWFPPQNDFDMFITNAAGTVIASNLQTANPSAIILPIPADGTVYHIIIEASVGAGNLEGLVKLIDIPAPVNQGEGAPPRYINYVAPPGGASESGEPSLGVDWNPNDASLKHDLVNTGGMAMFTANFNQYQVHFDDCSSPALNPWVDVTDPNEQITSLDPIGFTDHYSTAQLGISYPPPQTPGRTFQAQLAAGDSITSFTDDDGATHTPSQGGGVPAGPDHQTLGGGPFHAPVITPPAPAYPNAIYYCSQSLAEAECSRSDDGGLTFGPGVPIFNVTQCLGGIHGHVKVSPQGTVYVPNSSCGTGTPVGTNGVAVSTDNGITWNSFTVPDSTGGQDPSVAVGQNNFGKPPGQVSNTIYLGWVSADGHAHAAHSGDEGATWDDDIDVGSILGVKNAVFPTMVAGDDNRAAYSFIGTTTPGTPGDPSFPGVWHLYIAHTYDGGQNWILIDATPLDPVQKGQICLLGLGCSGGRNLLDFMDFTVDSQGRGLVGYADGCLNCNNSFTGQSHDARGSVARQSGGRRLFSVFDPEEPAPPAAPQVLSAVRASGQVTVSWLEPDNGGLPITGYKVYRSTTSGTETFLADVPATATKYFDNTAPSSSNWFYRVTAVNAVAEGLFCREVNVNGSVAGATACLAPYLQMAEAGSFVAPFTSDPMQGALTIEGVNAGEPFVSCSDNTLTITMKVQTLDSAGSGHAVLPENSEWRVLFDVLGTDNQMHKMFVVLDTVPPYDSSALPNFALGRQDPDETTGGTVDEQQCYEQPPLFDCPALEGSTYTKDGTITFKLHLDAPISFDAPSQGSGVAFTWDGSAVGSQVKNILGDTFVLAGIFLENVQTTGTTGPTYTRIGNIRGCNTTPPLAVLSANPLTGPAPLMVDFDGSGSFEPFGACGTINSYTMDFGDGSPPVTHASPLFSHSYASAGNYPARLTVSNDLGVQSVNQAQAVIAVGSSGVNLTSVVSRKTHGTAGTFDVDLPLSGNPGIECRTGGANGDHTLRFTFDAPIISVGGVTLDSSDGLATADTPVVAGGVVSVNVHNVANIQTLTVSLNNINGTGNDASVQMGVLAGDTNADRFVDSADIAQTKSQSGHAVTTPNYREDLNVDGFVDSADIALVKSKSGNALP